LQGPLTTHPITEINDRDEEHQEEETTEDSESEASVRDGLGNDVGKIAEELQKKKRQITAQYTRVLKPQDDNVCKHVQVLQNKKFVVSSTKKLHKTEMHELRAQLKCLKNEAKYELRVGSK
jgi:homoserine dehydrogenase